MTYEEERLALKVETLLDEIDQLKHELREVEFKLEDRSTLPFEILYQIYGYNIELDVNYKDDFPYKVFKWSDNKMAEILEFDKLNKFWLHWTFKDDTTNTLDDKEVFEIINQWKEEEE